MPRGRNRDKRINWVVPSAMRHQFEGQGSFSRCHLHQEHELPGSLTSRTRRNPRHRRHTTTGDAFGHVVNRCRPPGGPACHAAARVLRHANHPPAAAHRAYHFPDGCRICVDAHPIPAGREGASGPLGIAAGGPGRRPQPSGIVPAGVHLAGQDLVQGGSNGFTGAGALKGKHTQYALVPADHRYGQPFGQWLGNGGRNRGDQMDPSGAQVGRENRNGDYPAPPQSGLLGVNTDQIAVGHHIRAADVEGVAGGGIISRHPRDS